MQGNHLFYSTPIPLSSHFSSYWAAAALTLEPRLSSKWLANIAFLGTVISLPAPASSFFLPSATTYHPFPPPISTIIENILPTNNLKTHLTKGLQSSSPLVRYSAALALAKCLQKYDLVVAAFQEVADALEEEEDGQWRRAVVTLESEARKRVPEHQVIIAFSQQKPDTTQEKSTAGHGAPVATLKPLTASMISESALRILWLYHKCLPTLVAEGRFDSGKLLWSFLHHWNGEVQGQFVDGWDMVRRLHVLRLLKESDQFSWSGKPGDNNFSTVSGPLLIATTQLLRATYGFYSGGTRILELPPFGAKLVCCCVMFSPTTRSSSTTLTKFTSGWSVFLQILPEVEPSLPTV